MNAISIQNITKTYSQFTLTDLCLELPEGCVLGLVGENGAGKSTAISLILNTLKRDASCQGNISVLGTNNLDPSFYQIKNDIGVVLDESGFPESMTAKQVGNVMSKIYLNWDGSYYEELLRRFKVSSGKKFRDLSKGMKMKLAIATALSHQPKLLILDEATSGLDPLIRDEILDIFSEFTRQEDHSILISSHIVSDLEKICDYIAILHDGKLLLCEEKDYLKEKYLIYRTSLEDLQQLPKDCVIAYRKNPYGCDALITSSASTGRKTEIPSIEDIFLYMIKGDKLS